MAVIIQKRYDSEANWIANNPILAIAEEGWVTDLNQSKVGNGVDDWNTLVYVSGGGGGDLDGGSATSVYTVEQRIDGGGA